MNFLIILVASVCCSVRSAPTEDLIKNLPGLAFSPNFKQYSGYLTASSGRHLHYWFVESQGSPEADPLVLWLNGGPGCSSMDGLLSEHGPFTAAEDGHSLKKNPNAWNLYANMIYLEAPAGVGYSYKEDGNYTTSDDQTSKDNLLALKDFLRKFPEYQNNEFFLTGESYGGIYIPTLAERVVDDGTFNFKGFAVGNGLSDVEMNADSIIHFGHFHGLWGQDLWNEMRYTCCPGQCTDRCKFSESQDPKCMSAVAKAGAILGNLNIYNLYAECYQGSENGPTFKPLDAQPLILSTPFEPEWKKMLLALSGEKGFGIVPPCINANGQNKYMNRKEVRKALHIDDARPTWEICSGVVGALYKRTYNCVKEQYIKVLRSRKYRILVYNGDIDMACNFLGDEWFVDSLKQKATEPYRAWHYTASDKSQQTAGFVKSFYNLDFVTVKGAGHMVPSNKPVQALEMFVNFIKNKPFQ